MNHKLTINLRLTIYMLFIVIHAILFFFLMIPVSKNTMEGILYHILV